jgi:hypothetical protein
MMEWEPVYRVAMLGFLVGIVFGAVVNKTNFCTMGAVSDWINIGSKDRLRAWFLAIGIAILASQVMQAQGLIDLSEVMYLTPNFGWLGHMAVVRYWYDAGIGLWAAHTGPRWRR